MPTENNIFTSLFEGKDHLAKTSKAQRRLGSPEVLLSKNQDLPLDSIEKSKRDLGKKDQTRTEPQIRNRHKGGHSHKKPYQFENPFLKNVGKSIVF